MKTNVVLISAAVCLWIGSCEPEKTLPKYSGTVKDNDGNSYHTVLIGDQTWTAESLKTTHFNDGSSIPLIENDNSWINSTKPAYCWYNNKDSAGKAIYGALYNWYTVNSEKLCPIGWHIPTDEEWTALTNFLGGEEIAANKLKEAGTKHWKGSNSGATNETFFTALPGGARDIDGQFYELGNSGAWWTSSPYSTNKALYRFMESSSGEVTTDFYYRMAGLSVRCIKD
jgi:uncharacterized protein (TIGR02145 family)